MKSNLSFPVNRICKLLINPSIGLALLNSGTLFAQQPPVLYNMSDIFCENVVVKVQVNGFPALALPKTGNQAKHSGGISPFLKRGENRILVTLEPMLEQNGAEKAKHLLQLSMKTTTGIGAVPAPLLELKRMADLDVEKPSRKTVLSFPSGAENTLIIPGGDRGGLVQCNSTSRSLSYIPQLTQSHGIEMIVDLPQAPVLALPWEEPQVLPSDIELNAIKEDVLEIHAAMLAGDLAEFLPKFAAKHERVAASTGLTKADVDTQTSEILEVMLASDGFVLAPLALADLVVEPVATLNLVKVTKANGPAITGQGNELHYKSDFYFSRIAGNWVLVE